jgi:hypothetical protein
LIYATKTFFLNLQNTWVNCSHQKVHFDLE